MTGFSRMDRFDWWVLATCLGWSGLAASVGGSTLLTCALVWLMISASGLGVRALARMSNQIRPLLASLKTHGQMEREMNLHLENQAKMSEFRWNHISKECPNCHDMLEYLSSREKYSLGPEIIHFTVDRIADCYNPITKTYVGPDSYISNRQGEVTIYFYSSPGKKRDGSYCADEDNKSCSDYGCCPWQCPKGKKPVAKAAPPAPMVITPYVPFWEDPRIHEVDPPQPSRGWFEHLDWTDRNAVMAVVTPDDSFWDRVFSPPVVEQRQAPADTITIGPMEADLHHTMWTVGEVPIYPGKVYYLYDTPFEFETIREAMNFAGKVDRRALSARDLDKLTHSQMQALRDVYAY